MSDGDRWAAVGCWDELQCDSAPSGRAGERGIRLLPQAGFVSRPAAEGVVPGDEPERVTSRRAGWGWEAGSGDGGGFEGECGACGWGAFSQDGGGVAFVAAGVPLQGQSGDDAG